MTSNDFRPSINGLRGIAVLMVVLYHWSHVRGGFTGVDIFFVISGYLISGHIYRDLTEERFSLLSFYAKRVRRIIPSLTVILVAFFVLGWFRFFNDQFIHLGKHIQSAALFLSNFRLYQESGYFDDSAVTKPLLHLWSLALEEQFYLIWPVLLWASYKVFQSIHKVVIASIIFSFFTNIYLSYRNPSMDFYMLAPRLWELAFGSLVFLYRYRYSWFFKSRFVSVTGFGLVVASNILIRGQTGFPGYKALIPVIGASIVLGSSDDNWVNRKILGNRILGFFGTISFPLYLWHWPIYSYMKCMEINGSYAWLVSTTLVFSSITHYLCERPLMNLRVTSRNRLKILAAGIIILAGLALVGTLAGKGIIKTKYKANQLTKRITLFRRPIGCGVNGELGNSFDSRSLVTCRGNRYPDAPTVLLIGDSHAATLTGGMKAFADRNRINLLSVTTIDCTPLYVDDSRPACSAYNHYIIDWIARTKPDLVILFAYHLYWSDNEHFKEPIPYEKFISAKLNQIRQLTGKQVLLVGQVPTWKISLPWVIDSAFLSKGRVVPERTFEGLSMDSLEYDSVLQNEAKLQNVPYFSLKDNFCTVEGCVMRVGKILERDLIASDYGHFAGEGSQFAVRNGLDNFIIQLLSETRQWKRTTVRRGFREDLGYDVRQLGLLQVFGHPPAEVLVGHECLDCETEPVIFVVSESTGERVDLNFPSEYVQQDLDGNKSKIRVRAFMGHCLKNYSNSVVAFYEYQNGNGWVLRTAKVAILKADGALTQSILSEESLSKISLNDIVKEAPGMCREIRPSH